MARNFAAVRIAGDVPHSPLSRSRTAQLVDTLAESLRDAIRESGVSQNKIAKAIGCSQPAISQFMAGKSGMRLEVLAPLLEFLALEIRRQE